MIGTVFGFVGDRWNLGFLAETERQVVKHLDNHLENLPADDHKSRAILKQMRDDEANHATRAVNAGARDLPEPLKSVMALSAKIMINTATRI